MRLLDRLSQVFMQHGKRKTLQYLQSLPKRQLESQGFSPELIATGIAGWPWRIDKAGDTSAINRLSAQEERRSIRELQQYTDAELADLGIARHAIRHVVRHGRPGFEHDQTNRAA